METFQLLEKAIVMGVFSEKIFSVSHYLLLNPSAKTQYLHESAFA